MKASSSPLCSIIIPTFNTRDLTLACLANIQKYPPPGSYEVIVVDNNSEDGTHEQVTERFPDVIALRNSGNLGFARACNRGAQEAKGEYLLFLNSDTEPLESTFSTLLDWIKNHPKTAIVGPELIGPGGNLLQMSWSWQPLLGGEVIHRFFAPQNIGPAKFKQWLIRHLQRKPRRVPFICGACLLVRRDIFEQINGFDEKFELYFEDADFCWRCAKLGWDVDFVPQSKIVHHIGQSTKGALNMSSLIYQQSHITYYRKHAPSWSLFFLKSYLALKWLRLSLLSFFKIKDRVPAHVYCRSFRQVIFESKRYLLDGYLSPLGPRARRLNLGCGHDIKVGWVNLDSADLKGVDVVHDIEKSPWPFPDESFDHISANNILEHVDYIPVLSEAHRVLKKGGTLEIESPHFTSRNNWIDPTHKTTFSIRTFEFFVQNSRFGREYYFNFAFNRIRRQRLVFEKGWLFYNYPIEILVNLHPKVAVLYEATLLRNLFPSESVLVEFEK